jgi:hypothetical protein
MTSSGVLKRKLITCRHSHLLTGASPLRESNEPITDFSFGTRAFNVIIVDDWRVPAENLGFSFRRRSLHFSERI